jgi:SAM-dependent methyltransferase
VTGAPQLRPAAGWLTRRLAELLSDGAAALRAGRPGRGAGVGVVPPRRLRARAGAPGAAQYVEGGHRALAELEAALAPRQLGDFGSVLDFGCGPGRVIAHLPSATRCGEPGTDDPASHPTSTRPPVGVDVDAVAIAWARGHLNGARFEPSRAHPPLPFADASFELVYSISVFSHLDESSQDAWLAELARILAPAGTALLSTHGPSAFAAFRSGAVATAWCDSAVFGRHGPLKAGEMVAVPYRQNRWSRGDLPGVGAGYGLSFHDPGYIAERWGRFLQIEAVIPQAISGWQDLVVARKPRGD